MAGYLGSFVNYSLLGFIDHNEGRIGDQVIFPNGHLIQVKSMSTTADNPFFSTNSQTYDATGLKVDITPTYSTSKIFVIASINGVHLNAGAAVGSSAEFSLFRQTNILDGYLEHRNIGLYRNLTNGTDGGEIYAGSYALHLLDAPAVDTEVSYEIYAKTDAANVYTYFSGGTSEATHISSSITAMEVLDAQ